MRVPLQTIRFRGGDEVRMGVLFWRRVSRTGVSVAWPALEPGKWVEFDGWGDAEVARRYINEAIAREQARKKG